MRIPFKSARHSGANRPLIPLESGRGRSEATRDERELAIVDVADSFYCLSFVRISMTLAGVVEPAVVTSEGLNNINFCCRSKIAFSIACYEALKEFRPDSPVPLASTS